MPTALLTVLSTTPAEALVPTRPAAAARVAKAAPKAKPKPKPKPKPKSKSKTPPKPAPKPAPPPPPAPGPASVTVSGSLAGMAGTTVLLVSPSGFAKGYKLTSAGTFSFTLAPSNAAGASLQLVGTDGRYAGPVVLAAAADKAYTTLGGISVDLGALSVGAGYARVTATLPAAAVNVTNWARADGSGKPDGAGKLGMVRSLTLSTASVGVADAAGPGQDPDHDGIPNVFDVDSNGDGILNSVDPVTAATDTGAAVSTRLNAQLSQTINADAGPVDSGALDALLGGDHTFVMTFYADPARLGGRTFTGAHVDCATLAYCRAGDGTAELDTLPTGPMTGPVRWLDYTPDGSGLPVLAPWPGGSAFGMNIMPKTTSANIHPGDSFQVIFGSGSDAVTLPASLGPYFVTTPAITSWSSGSAGASVTYPVTDPSAAELSAPTGSLALTFWRPQRTAIPGTGESSYVDMGHLHYGVAVGVPGRSELGCGAYFSGLSGDLTNEYVAPSGGGPDMSYPLHDGADDQAPDSGRTLGFSVDLAGCMRAAGVDPTGLQVHVRLQAVSEGRAGGRDVAGQDFTVQL
jgi:hypothetical protein